MGISITLRNAGIDGAVKESETVMLTGDIPSTGKRGMCRRPEALANGHDEGDTMHG